MRDLGLMYIQNIFIKKYIIYNFNSNYQYVRAYIENLMVMDF